MENMRFKVGDRVRIKSLDWYNENKGPFGELCPDFIVFLPSRSKYCGQIMTIKEVLRNSYNSDLIYYKMIEDAQLNDWTNGMIEGLVEEDVDLIPKFGEFSDNEPFDIPTMTTDFIKEHGFPCPEGYIFKDENGNVINATKIVLEKKKKEYPKTFVKCRAIVGLDLNWDNPFRINRDTHPYIKHLDYLMEGLFKLLICRDAYWKIAGEEMGLGKPWEPDWTSTKYKYCITTRKNKVEPLFEMNVGFIFAFPTEEMRDAFYENFKEEIEMCKEFL